MTKKKIMTERPTNPPTIQLTVGHWGHREVILPKTRITFEECRRGCLSWQLNRWSYPFETHHLAKKIFIIYHKKVKSLLKIFIHQRKNLHNYHLMTWDLFPVHFTRTKISITHHLGNKIQSTDDLVKIFASSRKKLFTHLRKM